MEVEQSSSKKNIYKMLVSKPNFYISKKGLNIYEIKTTIENTYYYLDQIVHFNLIKFIYEVNKENFETIDLQIINENEAKLYILAKHLFKELGTFQRYLHFKIYKYTYNNSIRFHCVSCHDTQDQLHKTKAILAPIKQMVITFNIHNSHKLEMIQEIYFDDSFILNSIFEKLFISLVKKCTLQIVESLQKLK